MSISLPIFPDSSLLTHSATKCWNACRRRYLFAYVHGIRRQHASEPLRIGTMWHLGVGAYESGVSIDDSIAMVRQAYRDTPCPNYLQPDEYAVEEEKVTGMIYGHWDHWKNDDVIKSVAVEQVFDLPIVNPETGYKTPSFTSAGKIDRIGRLPDGTLAVVERKTTSEDITVDSAYWKSLRNDPQISRYLLAARAMGHDVTKVVYDVIKKPQIKPRRVEKAEIALANSTGFYCGLKLTGPCPERENPAMYGARLRADIASRPDFYLARVEIARTDGDLEEYQYDLWQTQQEIRQAMNSGRFYRNPASCLEPFNCEYLDVCSELYANPEVVPSGFRKVSRLHEEL